MGIDPGEDCVEEQSASIRDRSRVSVPEVLTELDDVHKTCEAARCPQLPPLDHATHNGASGPHLPRRAKRRLLPDPQSSSWHVRTAMRIRYPRQAVESYLARVQDGLALNGSYLYWLSRKLL